MKFYFIYGLFWLFYFFGWGWLFVKHRANQSIGLLMGFFLVGGVLFSRFRHLPDP